MSFFLGITIASGLLGMMAARGLNRMKQKKANTTVCRSVQEGKRFFLITDGAERIEITKRFWLTYQALSIIIWCLIAVGLLSLIVFFFGHVLPVSYGSHVF